MAPPSHKFKSKSSSKRPGSHSNISVPSSQLPLQLEDDVPGFPRGGASSFSREERNGVREGAEKDFEKDNRILKKRTKDKRVQNNDNLADDDLGLLFGDGITGKLPRFANKITFKNVSLGMKLWGVIAEVNEKDIIVSLPGGLRGLVRACDAFDPVSSDEVKGVLSAYVNSIEDHGFMLHFGLPSFSGFMPKQNQPGSRNLDVGIGYLLQGIVKSVDKVVHMSSDLEMVSKYVTKELKGISIDLLVPGMMVKARVQSTLENSVLLSFLTYFTGTGYIQYN